jgi:hypothetical protein
MDINALHSSGAILPATGPAIPVDRATDGRDVIPAVKALNGAGILGEQNELLYHRDPQTRHFVIRLVNRTTGEVVSQVPAEYVLRLAEDLKQES